MGKGYLPHDPTRTNDPTNQRELSRLNGQCIKLLQRFSDRMAAYGAGRVRVNTNFTQACLLRRPLGL